MKPNNLLEFKTPYLTVIPVLACLLITACSTKKTDSDTSPGNSSNPWMEADLATWRVKGRREMQLGDVGVMYATRIIKHADGTATATGNVYAEGLSPSPGGKLGWPAHAYGNEAEWAPDTQTLELKGWPVLEYRKSRVIGSKESTTMTISPDLLKIHGPSSMRLIAEEKARTKESEPTGKEKDAGK